MATKRDKAGARAEEASGQIPVPEDRDDVMRSERNPARDKAKEPARRRTYGQPVPVSDKPKG